MITEVVMPQMGADMKEGTILRWLKQEGEAVERGEIIAEIETDKANVEIEAFGAGVFRKTMHAEGDVIPVGEVIAVIGAPDDDISKYEKGTATAAAATSAPAQPEAKAESTTPPEGQAPAAADAAPQPQETSEPKTETPTAAAPKASESQPAPVAVQQPTEGRLRISPLARRLAEEAGIDPNTVKGTGPDGRILRRDIEAAKSAPQAAPAQATSAQAPRPPAPTAGDVVQDVPLSRIRSTIARRMQQAKQEVPHYYLSMDVDMTEAKRFADAAQKVVGDAERITVNNLVILATARTLVQHPKFNAYWVDGHVQTHSQINVGVAVALDDGLVVPAILDCAFKGLQQISHEARDVAQRARSGSLRPEEYTAATFNISNIGPFGIEGIVPIITPPQVGVLGIGAAKDKPAVHNGEIAIRSIMTVVLSADHRATDGADGARFLATLRRYLESPELMLL